VGPDPICKPLDPVEGVKTGSEHPGDPLAPAARTLPVPLLREIRRDEAHPTEASS